jgi:hypothetical protein
MSLTSVFWTFIFLCYKKGNLKLEIESGSAGNVTLNKYVNNLVPASHIYLEPERKGSRISNRSIVMKTNNQGLKSSHMNQGRHVIDV